jgi:dTDP-4-amino-4,6-dideoxygalactose transaminase
MARLFSWRSLLRREPRPDESRISFLTCPWRESDLPAFERRAGKSGAQTDFESFLRHHLAIESAASVSLTGSGRSALRLGLEALALEAGERLTVILPTYCCLAVLQAVLDAGFHPRFVDAGPELNANADQILAAVDDRTRCAVIVNLCGKSLESSERALLLRELRRRGIVSIEDNCHKFVPPDDESRADMEFYSFAFSKSLNATAGGLLVSRLEQRSIGNLYAGYEAQDEERVRERARYYVRRFGSNSQTEEDTARFARSRTEYGRVGMSRTDIALAIERISSIEKIVAAQKENGAALFDIVARYPSIYGAVSPSNNIYTRFPLVLADVGMFNLFWTFMSDRKIDLEGMYAPLHLSPAVATQPVKPFAEAVYQRVFNVPNRADLSDRQLSIIRNALDEFPRSFA